MATPQTAPTRVFIVDDHEIVRRGVADLLELYADFEVIGEAGTAAQALSRIPAARPDVVILDVRLPDGNGVEVCRALRSELPDTAVLMLTSYSDPQAEVSAALAGAAGYVLKDIHGDALLDVIRRVAAGEVLVDPGIVTDPARFAPSPGVPDAGWQRLSPQERRVLTHIGEGLTNRQIAERMSLSERTVGHYVSAMLDKLDLQRRTQAATYITRLQTDGRVPPEL